MKNTFLILTSILCLSVFLVYGQEKKESETKKESEEKIGLFKNVKTGFTITYFHNFQGEYTYILQQNSRVVEKTENKDGASLSVVIIFPLDNEVGKWNLILNIPIVDLKATTNIFNSQTPFGIGSAYFPFKKAKFLGFTAMANIGRQNRMREDAINNQFFPIASYPNYKLSVGAPVPSSVLEPFFQKVTTFSLNSGLILRL